MKKYLIESNSESERLNFQNTIDVYDINKELNYFEWDKKDIVLDAGCGNGNVIEKLLEKKLSKIHGIDMSSDRVLHTVERFKNFKNVHISQGLLENTSLAKSSFDKIICRYIFEHVLDPSAIIKELGSLLKINGQFYIINFDDVFFGFYTKNKQFNEQLKKFKTQLQQDFEIGRKLPQLLMQSGFSNISWHAETFFFKEDRLSLEIENSKMRLSQGRDQLSQYFDSVEQYDNFAETYLNEMKDPNNVLSSTKYLIHGKKEAA